MARDKYLHVRMSEAEMGEWREAARLSHVELADWVRRALWKVVDWEKRERHEEEEFKANLAEWRLAKAKEAE